VASKDKFTSVSDYVTRTVDTLSTVCEPLLSSPGLQRSARRCALTKSLFPGESDSAKLRPR
ncbi:Hypothetical predicted protein, partial [Scomber scombrus]